MASSGSVNMFGKMCIDNNQYVIHNVPGDGNCFFHCLSFLKEGDLSHTTMYRNLVCGMIHENWANWSDKVSLFHSPLLSRDDYEDGMLNSNWFASACEVEAASILLNSEINIWLIGKNSSGHQTYHLTSYNTNSGSLEVLNLILINEHFMALKPVTASENGLREPLEQTYTQTDFAFSNNIPSNASDFSTSHDPSTTSKKRLRTLLNDDNLFHICRKLGIWSAFEKQTENETKQEQKNRFRRIRNKINKQENKLNMSINDIPDCPPQTNDHQFDKAMDCIRSFELEQMSYNLQTCIVCNETHICTDVWKKNTCRRCSVDKRPTKMFSRENNMDPGMQPLELQKLTMVEQQLIARISPCLNVYMMRHGGIASSGHCVTFPQEVNEPAKIFPRLPCEIEIIKVCKHGRNETVKDFKVSRSRIEKALNWLKKNNPAYHDITISQSRLLLLPENGELSEIATAQCNADSVYTNDEGPAPNQINIDGLDDDCQTVSGVLFQDNNINIKEKVQNIVSDVLGNSSSSDASVRQDKKGVLTLPWPTRGSNPLSEFSTQYFFTLAFPCLFPYGIGDFHINRPVTCQSLGDWAEHLLWFKDGRFARHQYFKFVVHNMILRKQALEKGSYIVKQKLGDPHLTVNDIKLLIEKGDKAISQKILYFSDSIRGTSQYWARRYKEVKALENFKIQNGDGLPSFFTTGSCAEFHFKPLRRLLTMFIEHSTGNKLNVENSSYLFKALQENTHIVAKYFDLRTQSYFENIMKPVFGVDTYWYRQEFTKSRGMVHWHGLCWRSDREPHNLTYRCVEAGLSNAECAAELAKWAQVQFGLSAEHPAGKDDSGIPNTHLWPPPEGTMLPPPEEKNPLVKLLMDVSSSQESVLEDYLLLTNRFNIHRCSDYCLKPNRYNSSLKQCRLEFGTENNPGKKIRFEPDIIKDKNGSLRLAMPRDHPMLVQHSRFHTQGWRANGDISLIVSQSCPDNPSVNEIIATEKYITGYACKGNKTSEALSDLFSEMIDLSASKNETAQTFCQKYLINTVKRDVSAVEVCYELAHLPLFRCSHSFQSVSMSGFRVFEKDGIALTKNTALDNYMSRNPEDNCSFYEYISRNGKVPVFSSSVQASWPLTEKYSEFQLLLHWPNWRKPSDIKHDSTSWTDAMLEFLDSSFCPNFVKADIERSKIKENFQDDLESNIDIASQQPDWMNALRPDMQYEDTVEEFAFDDGGESYNWSENAHLYPGDLGKTFVENLSEVERNDTDVLLPDVDLQSLNNDQLFAFNIVMSTFLKSIHKEPYEPLRLIVSGTAGSGKSYLIKCIVKASRTFFNSNKVVQVVCPTGNSANIINGVTIHSYLKVPVYGAQKEMLAPEGSVGDVLQSNLEGLKILLVDERSMVGATTLGWMEFMCRHGVDCGKNSHISWGGLPVVVFLGDDVQLPPVLDSPVYNCKSNIPAALHGVVVWQEFQNVVTLRSIVRQNESENLFKNVLLSLRTYSCSLVQSEWLQQFQWQNVENKYGKCVSKNISEKGLFVFPTHSLVWEHNKQKLADLNKSFPVAKISAQLKGRHNSRTESSNSLPSTVFLCKNAKVMLTVNLSVKFGLFNGALGIVRDIIYLDGKKPQDGFPDVVMVEFFTYTGPPFTEDNPKLVPIVDVERRIDCICHNCKRRQVPLRLGWATTIHKCQGMTVGQGEPNAYIVIDPGTKTFEAKNPGALFVALSRAKSSGSKSVPPDFAWNPAFLANSDRICYKVNNKLTIARDKEIRRIEEMTNQTKEIFQWLLDNKTIISQF